MINIKIDNQEYSFEEGLTILEACRKVNIDIPTLCYYKDLVQSGNCRVCLVEVKGNRNFVTACNQKIYEGMEILTNTLDIIEARKIEGERLKNDIEKRLIVIENNVLFVEDISAGTVERDYLYKGIASRNFKWSLKLPEFSVIDKVNYINGLLQINIKIEIPEAKKPKVYSIE